jgi:hypothetical protein
MQTIEVPSSRLWKVAEKIFDVLSSLKLAVLVILSLAIALAVATFLESLYDTPTAQYWIYRATWFHLILALLGVNIFSVAMSRLPWKFKHIPFLLAHLGILLLLMGSWITEQIGTDGNLRVSEGEAESVVELDQAALVLSENNQVFSVPIPWMPPGVRFHPVSVKSAGIPYALTVDQFLSHAEPEVSFIPRSSASPQFEQAVSPGSGALRVRVVGGPMRISQEVWLWEGAPQWKEVQAGPARFWMTRQKLHRGNASFQVAATGPSIGFEVKPDGIAFLSRSSDGKFVEGFLSNKKGLAGKDIHPGWKGNVLLTVEEWIPEATLKVVYQPSRMQYGPQAPTSAIHVVGDQGESAWLGLGDRAVLHLGGREVGLGYFPRRLILPFSLRLDRFVVEHDPGTQRPAAYASQVTTLQSNREVKATISMNEPLELHGYTLYQASYEDGDPRPVTSILSVNRDPGRTSKYLGSLLIVLGSILLFVSKVRKKSKVQPARVIS